MQGVDKINVDVTMTLVPFISAKYPPINPPTTPDIPNINVNEPEKISPIPKYIPYDGRNASNEKYVIDLNPTIGINTDISFVLFWRLFITDLKEVLVVFFTGFKYLYIKMNNITEGIANSVVFSREL